MANSRIVNCQLTPQNPQNPQNPYKKENNKLTKT